MTQEKQNNQNPEEESQARLALRRIMQEAGLTLAQAAALDNIELARLGLKFGAIAVTGMPESGDIDGVEPLAIPTITDPVPARPPERTPLPAPDAAQDSDLEPVSSEIEEEAPTPEVSDESATDTKAAQKHSGLSVNEEQIKIANRIIDDDKPSTFGLFVQQLRPDADDHSLESTAYKGVSNNKQTLVGKVTQCLNVPNKYVQASEELQKIVDRVRARYGTNAATEFANAAKWLSIRPHKEFTSTD